MVSRWADSQSADCLVSVRIMCLRPVRVLRAMITIAQYVHAHIHPPCELHSASVIMLCHAHQYPLCYPLHCTTLHCTAQHCTALHCTALHFSVIVPPIYVSPSTWLPIASLFLISFIYNNFERISSKQTVITDLT